MPICRELRFLLIVLLVHLSGGRSHSFLRSHGDDTEKNSALPSATFKRLICLCANTCFELCFKVCHQNDHSLCTAKK